MGLPVTGPVRVPPQPEGIPPGQPEGQPQRGQKAVEDDPQDDDSDDHPNRGTRQWSVRQIIQRVTVNDKRLTANRTTPGGNTASPSRHMREHLANRTTVPARIGQAIRPIRPKSRSTFRDGFQLISIRLMNLYFRLIQLETGLVFVDVVLSGLGLFFFIQDLVLQYQHIHVRRQETPVRILRACRRSARRGY